MALMGFLEFVFLGFPFWNLLLLYIRGDLVAGHPALKGKPVRFRRYPRSCNKASSLEGMIVEDNHCFGSTEWEGFNNALSQKTCQVS